MLARTHNVIAIALAVGAAFVVGCNGNGDGNGSGGGNANSNSGINIPAQPSPDGFDHTHAALGALLGRLVNPQGMVDYAGLKERHDELKAYLGTIAGVSADDYSTFTREQKLAYLINAYNACTLHVIVEHLPLNSILDIEGGKVWDTAKFKVMGKDLTLNEIEKSYVLPETELDFPLGHVALVCAAMSCPILIAEPYEHSLLDDQVQESAERFARDTARNKLDKDTKKLRVSQIFNWYRDDFTRGWGSVETATKGDDAGIVGFFASYLTGIDQRWLKDNAVTVEFLEYDWKLNKQ